MQYIQDNFSYQHIFGEYDLDEQTTLSEKYTDLYRDFSDIHIKLILIHIYLLRYLFNDLNQNNIYLFKQVINHMFIYFQLCHHEYQYSNVRMDFTAQSDVGGISL